jgi:hypothetical protein
MHTTARPAHAGRFVLLVLALAATLAATLGACSLLPPGTVPSTLTGPIVTFQSEGGECPQGECGFKAEIWRDGRVVRSDGMAQTVDEMSLRRLVEQVDRADWEAILAVPFEGECPRNFDGQEEIYTFHVGAEPIVVASCTTAVDHAQEPFQTVVGVLFGVGG